MKLTFSFTLLRKQVVVGCDFEIQRKLNDKLASASVRTRGKPLEFSMHQLSKAQVLWLQ